MKPTRIVPAILSCAANLQLVEQFVDSYEKQLKPYVAAPVVVVDLTTSQRLPGSYLDMLRRLGPRAVYLHPKVPDIGAYDSVEDATFYLLAKTREEMLDSEDWLLWLEDDVIFSSKLAAYLQDNEFDANAGFYTFYHPGGGYGNCKIINPHQFYGTQCVMIPRDSAKRLNNDRAHIVEKFKPCYDIRWSRYFADVGMLLYQSDRSYVQHLASDSRLKNKGHHSQIFVP